jgi:hypothetical protein
MVAHRHNPADLLLVLLGQLVVHVQHGLSRGVRDSERFRHDIEQRLQHEGSLCDAGMRHAQLLGSYVFFSVQKHVKVDHAGAVAEGGGSAHALLDSL